MIAIAILPSLSEAYVLKSILELENITVFISNEAMRDDVVKLVPSGVVFQVQVADEDVERALKIAEGFPKARVLHSQPQ